MNKQKNYGFVPSEITSDQYVLGAFNQLPKIILKSDRNWKDFLPTWESQVDKFETYGCTCFGTLNAIETILNRLDLLEVNYDFSERYNYILAGIRPPGADPQYVSEIVRKYGVIEQGELPFTNTYDEFIAPSPMTVPYLVKGQDWLRKYNFGHEWVFNNTPSKELRTTLIREALQYSPICLSVSAWYEQDGLFVDNGLPNNHWTLCYGIDDDGGLLIFDSYALIQSGVVTNAFKKLHPDHKVLCAKRYFIEAKNNEEKLSWIGQILKWLFGDVQELKKKVDVVAPVKPAEVYAEVKEALKVSKLDELCLAIRDYEGKPGDLNYRNNNPGNVRGRNGKFLKFTTMEEGMNYLKDYVRRAATGEHRAYKKGCTLLQFFKVYAPSNDNNNPDAYAKHIAKRLGVTVDTRVVDII